MGSMNQLFGGGNPPKWVSGTYTEGTVMWSPTDYQYYMNKSTGARATDPASDPTNWQPTGERAIKSIQRGVITISGGSGTATLSPAVVTSKTELRMLGFSVNGSSLNLIIPKIVLTNGTTVTATVGGAGEAAYASWELTERY